MLSQFPSTAGEEPVTRDALRAELAEFRAELHIELGRMHDQMRQMAMWVVGAILGGMGLAAGIGSALG